MEQPPDLDALYEQAQAALASRDFERAAELLKRILIADENYKDASRLMAGLVARRRGRWYKGARIWIGVAAVAFLGVLLASKDIFSGSPTNPPPTGEVVARTPTTISQPTETLVQTATPTTADTPATGPTTVPLHWKRLYSGAIFPRAEISSIALDPNDPDVMYVGTSDAGIYKSLNGGQSWQPTLTNLGLRDILTSAIDPQDAKTMYVGTDGEGLYRTRDGGIHWERLIDRGNDLAIDPQKNDHLILAAGEVLMESSDGGQSWSEIQQTSLCPTSYDKIAIDPANGDVLYALDRGACGDPNMGDEIYGSTDGGDHWVLLDSRSWSVGLLDVETASNGDVYSLTGLKGAGDGILRSEGGGETWIWFAQLSLPGGDHGAMVVSPDNPNTMIAGSVGLQISRDGGNSWEARQDGLGAAVLNLILNPADPLNLFVEGASVGWNSFYYRSEDGGQTWTEMGRDWRGMTIDADGVVYVSGQRSWDRGRHWEETVPGVGEIITADPKESGLLYADGFMSTNGGETWLPSGELGYGHETRLFVGENIIYALDRSRLRYSLDHGRTWDVCSDAPGRPSSANARAAIDPTNDERIFLATRSGGIQSSESGCRSWQSRNEGLGSLYANTVAIDPKDTDVVYAGTDDGAYVSFDGGVSWGEINDGLLGATVVYSIVVDPQGQVYAATPYGIFKLEGR